MDVIGAIVGICKVAGGILTILSALDVRREEKRRSVRIRAGAAGNRIIWAWGGFLWVFKGRKYMM